MINDFDKLHIIAWGLLAIISIWLVVLTIKLKKISTEKKRVGSKLISSDNAIDVLSNLISDIEELSRRQLSLADVLKKHHKMINESIRAVGLVRYDAFHDIGGEFSFSAALLDDNGDGLIISSINGRNEGRVYTKLITDGIASSSLSVEEEEAVAKALSSSADYTSEEAIELGSKG